MRGWREEWNDLRGLPERESPTIGDELCNEESDAQRLCEKPLVSIVCLVWGHEKWLDECIASMVKQKTDFAYEILLCEDYSPDESREICLKWQKRHPEKIRVISGCQNMGVWRNAALGCREARGLYIAFLEGDDYWTDSCKLQKQMDLIQAKGYRFVVAWNDIFHDATARIETRSFPRRSEITLVNYKGGYYHTSTYVVARDLREKITALCRFVLPCDTAVFLLALGLGEKIGVVTSKVSVYRQTGSGIYTGNSGAQNAEVAIRMFTALLRHGPKSLRSFCRYSYACALLDYFIHTTRNSGFAWRNLLSLGLAAVNLTFKINSRHTFFLWRSAIKSFFVRTRCEVGK